MHVYFSAFHTAVFGWYNCAENAVYREMQVDAFQSVVLIRSALPSCTSASTAITAHLDSNSVMVIKKEGIIKERKNY